MPTTCAIDFENNPHKVVQAGQLLRGTIKMSLTNEKQVRGAYIRIYGKAYCHWTTGGGESGSSYTGQEEYLNETTYFIGGQNGEIQLTAGDHNYNFRINLPSYLPTSVESGIGYIRYTISAVVDNPNTWHNKEFNERFTVLRPLDLNSDYMLRNPISVEETTTLCFGSFLCWFSGPIEIAVNIPVGGYVSGQTINLEIHVKNRSNQTIASFDVRLIKKINFYAESDTVSCSGSQNEKVVKCLIACAQTQGCGKNADNIIRSDLTIPAVPPTDSLSSSVVKVTYFIQISASSGFFYKHPVLKIPIIIGTRPFLDSFPTTPISPTLSLPPAYPTDEEPPTYAEAIDDNEADILNY